MPINKNKWGVHEDVLWLEFGHGDICFSGARYTEDDKTRLLVFQQDAVHPIGFVNDENTGKTTDELQNVKMVFQFSKPESITALIHSLVEVQRELFEIQNK